MAGKKAGKGGKVLAFAGIGIIALGLSGAFAWSAGLIGRPVTTSTFLKNVPEDFPAGYRRAHGRGLCFAGTFTPTTEAAGLSSATVFSSGEIPALGRFSFGGGNPNAPDLAGRTQAMALMLTGHNGDQWRMKLNNIPYFVTRDPEGFLARGAAFKPDPTTGEPDPAKVEAFLKAYPEAAKFLAWEKQAPWSGSFAGETFNVVNAFIFTNAEGQKTAVRWSLQPRQAFVPLSDETKASAGPNYLFDDLRTRVEQGPLLWDIVAQLAEPGDPVDDPSQPWPDSRRKVTLGTLTVTEVSDQTNGACRDVNFDPTLVPSGMALSNDPVLKTRAGIYAHSYNARVREIGYGRATDAVGQPKGDAR